MKKAILYIHGNYDMAYDAPTTFSNALDEIAAGIQVKALARPNARDNSLMQSIHHLEKSSGLFSTLYKVYAIWGTKGEEKLLEHLKANYEANFKPDADKNSDIQYWLGKHMDSLAGTRLEDLF